MKPATYVPINHAASGATTAHQRDSSPGTASGDVKTLTLNKNTSAILLTVETTNARVTFDGSDPGAASAPSNVFPKDSIPVLVPIGCGEVVKWCSTAAAASVVQICELS